VNRAIKNFDSGINFVFSDNTFTAAASAISAAPQYSVDGMRIQNNRMVNCQKQAIGIVPVATVLTRAHITDNTAYNCGTSGTAVFQIQSTTDSLYERNLSVIGPGDAGRPSRIANAESDNRCAPCPLCAVVDKAL
jgi:hypothetical protein